MMGRHGKDEFCVAGPWPSVYLILIRSRFAQDITVVPHFLTCTIGSPIFANTLAANDRFTPSQGKQIRPSACDVLGSCVRHLFVRLCYDLSAERVASPFKRQPRENVGAKIHRVATLVKQKVDPTPSPDSTQILPPLVLLGDSSRRREYPDHPQWTTGGGVVSASGSSIRRT